MNIGKLAIKKRNKETQLAAVKKELTTLESRNEELLKQIDESDDKELETIEKELEDVTDKIGNKQQEEKDLEDEIEILEKDLKEKKERSNQALKGGKRVNGDDVVTEQRDALNAFVRSKGLEKRDGLVSGDVGQVIPVGISYNPELEVKTVTDLASFLEKTTVKTASGKHPILKKATGRLNTVAELEKNPKLAKPEFLQVPWEVKTYRGAIPLSQEAIDDSAVDLMDIVSKNAREQKVNTTNFATANTLKTFTSKTIATADDLKKIINVDLDPAYNIAIVASQSFFHILDTLKDANGRYLLQDDITTPSGKRVFGKPVAVIEDTLFGTAGDAKAFVGDLKRAGLFADRKDLEIRWATHEIYGEYLQAVLRFDIVKADKESGYFVTYTESGVGGA